MQDKMLDSLDICTMLAISPHLPSYNRIYNILAHRPPHIGHLNLHLPVHHASLVVGMVSEGVSVKSGGVSEAVFLPQRMHYENKIHEI